jgi:hypothetical protein
MDDHRREKRIDCYGRVLAGNTPGHLRDVNEKGCKITTLSPLNAENEKALTFRMIPDPETGIGQSFFTGTIRWTKIRSGFFYYGILVESFSSDESLTNYKEMCRLYST